MVTRPKEYGNAMPTPERQELSNRDWIDLFNRGDLEVDIDEKNRVRLPATVAQVTRMDQALGWTFEYLRDRPDLARAISLRAYWSVLKVDIRKRCERKGIDHTLFNRQWQEALTSITGALIASKVPVS